MSTVVPFSQAQSKPSRRDIHQQVTDTIIEQLEAGTVPWHQPWRGGNSRIFSIPKNFTTKKHYRGINILLLWTSAINKEYASDEWASFKQWLDRKEVVRKGEKGTFIVYYDTFEKEVDGEIKNIPFLKASFVFNRCQLTSYEPKTKEPSAESVDLVERIEKVDTFINNSGAAIYYKDARAFYSPSEDKIYMPHVTAFKATETCTPSEGYYSTLLHELVHWTGSAKRLKREGGKKFGDQKYATEELVAEFGSAFMCSEFGINVVDKGDPANYIAYWLKVLKENKHCLITAASEASKAVDYLQALQPN